MLFFESCIEGEGDGDALVIKLRLFRPLLEPEPYAEEDACFEN